MDSLGSLELAWAQGYEGSSAEYITRGVLCFKCGNSIKFIGEDGHESICSAFGDSMGPIAVHSINKVFAYAETGIEPVVYVMQYPTFRVVAELKGGAQLEYAKMAFSSSDYLATVTGVPDYQLVIWNYTTGTKLCTHDLQHVAPTSLSFNPANWRQLYLSTEKELILFSVEQRHDYFMVQEKKMRPPAVDGSDQPTEDRDIPTRASTRMTRVTVDLPHTSVAGVRGREAEKFEAYEDTKERCLPVSHCWLPSGDVLVGCSGGQLVRLDSENHQFYILYSPGPRSASAFSRVDSAKPFSREISELELQASSTSLGTSNMMSEGSMNCLALHKEGLYAAGDDGTIRHLDVTQDKLRVLETYPLGIPVTSLKFDPPHHKLAVGSSRGSIHIYDPSDPGNVQQFLDIHCGNFLTVAMLAPGTERCVTVRADGEVQVWSATDAKLLGSFSIGYQTCSMACSPLAHLVAVGTASGHLYVVDANEPDNLRLIYRSRLHQGPVDHVVFNSNGHLLLTGSDDGHVMVVDGRPSKQFAPLGHASIPGEVKAIGTYLNDSTGVTKVVVTTNNTDNRRLAATKLHHFDLPESVTEDPRSLHNSLKFDFSDSAIKKLAFNFTTPSCGIAVAGGNVAYVLSQGTKQIHKISLPTEPSKKEHSKDSYLQPQAVYPAHSLPGGQVLLSPHHKWLASCGADGKLTVRPVAAMDQPIDIHAHDYHVGGANSMAFSADAQIILTTGCDGTMTCHKWNASDSSRAGKSAIESARARQSRLLQEQQAEDEAARQCPDWTAPSGTTSRPTSGVEKAEQEELEKEQEIARAMQNDQIYTTPTPTPGADATWLQAQELKAIQEEDKEYADIKHQLRTEIRDMRRKIQGMMKDNETLPDIEKLARQEFDLDVEQQMILQAEGEAEINRIREEKEFDNLAKMYLAELIRKECWDDMEVKGRGITGFGGTLEVSNYPMKARPREQLDELETVKIQRKLEIAELKARQELTENQKKTKSSQPEEEGENEEAEGEGHERPATTGSLDSSVESPGWQYGGDSDLMYSQFELHTREQKMNQIVLLQDAIHRIKLHFNKSFTEVFEKKEQEISKIREKNKRICKILEDLELPDEVWEPEMGSIEKPETLLAVKDEEVKVEKFLTPEQRKKQAEEEKKEEERRLREKADNWRERGLDQMMGGVLEIKKEDELKKDIAKPAFMTGKEEDDWTEEELKLAQEYERKVKELQEEREKYRKQLEMELRKLQSVIQEGAQTFDETLNQLFQLKIKTEMAIYQEELKILRLRYSLLLEEELNNRETELTELLEFKKEMKQLAGQALAETKKHVTDFKESYDFLVAEDKVMDKAFKRDFNDVPALQVDQLYRLFKKRPRGQKARGTETPMFDPSSGNPFAERPSTARQADLAKRGLEAALAEQDKETNKPEGVEPHVWERLCLHRRQKIESEQLVKLKALVLAEMQAFQQRRQEDDTQLHDEIDELIEAINKLKEDRMRFTCNLEVQLVLKQGQVEVDQGTFIPNYKQSLLLHRSVVEELNGKIRQLGEGKISSMIESKDFRKGIIQLEWEHKKMTMEMEDFQNKMRDIQNLKVTREIQAYLNEDDYDAKKQQEIGTLEQTIGLQKEHHEKDVNDKKKILRDLKRTIQDKSDENSGLSAELEGLNVSVNERRHINEVNADKRSDAGREQRYREIVQRRKLVDLAKAQAQEVAVLRAEVERLRMRTFPALVQVEH